MATDNDKMLPADELMRMLEELDDEELANLPEEEILKFRKQLNPYGRTIAGADKYLNFSITRITDEYWKKFIISAFIGFLNRMNDEWKVPEGVPVTPVFDYLDDPSKADTPPGVLRSGNKRTIDDYEFNREWMAKRLVVKEFLEEMFQFNPDEHVRSAYRPCRADKTRKPITTHAAKLAITHHKLTDKEFEATEKLYEEHEKHAEPTTKFIEKTIRGRNGKKRVIKKEVPLDYEPKDSSEKIVKNGGVDNTIGETLREMIPPHDVFGRFKTYYESNLEEIRDFVADAYCEKPDFELAINPYAMHDTMEEAEEFKKRHADEVIAEVFTAVTGKWNFFDAFKKQRESVKFYNKNTIILEEMTKQLERDERLGQDLMKKRVRKQKKKNAVMDGEDAESFKQWRKENSTLSKMGAEYIGDMADPEIPDDAIQVDVWRVAKGGLEITKDKFYSKAEVPTFLTDDIETHHVQEAMKAAESN